MNPLVIFTCIFGASLGYFFGGLHGASLGLAIASGTVVITSIFIAR